MKCPKCGEQLFTLETRTRKDGAVRRTRTCSLGHRVTTLEAVVLMEDQRGPGARIPLGEITKRSGA